MNGISYAEEAKLVDSGRGNAREVGHERGAGRGVAEMGECCGDGNAAETALQLTAIIMALGERETLACLLARLYQTVSSLKASLW